MSKNAELAARVEALTLEAAAAARKSDRLSEELRAARAERPAAAAVAAAAGAPAAESLAAQPAEKKHKGEEGGVPSVLL